MARDLTAVVDGMVHESTQTQDDGLDLTLAAVYEVGAPARVDFGGDELEAPERLAVPTAPRNLRDEYEWYQLDAGQYIVEFNESLHPPDDRTYWLQTRDVVRASGAFHPGVRVRDLGPMPFVVGGGGIRLKENARVSTLFEE
ncbi:MAG: dCTP deaminase [Halanaeroarchaeum sp.]